MRKGTCIKQNDQSDCGPACIASVAAHYRLRLPISRIRQYASTDREGTNISGLIEAAGRLGFKAKGAKGAPDSLGKIPLPAIAHTITPGGLMHFVVIYKLNSRSVRVMDPAEGICRRLSKTKFLQSWTGILVLLLPDTGFRKENQRIPPLHRFWRLLAPHRSVMLQALIGALVYTVLGLASSVYMQKLVDFVLADGNTKLLNLLSMGMLLIIGLQLYIGVFKNILSLRTGQHIDARLILGYYRHILRLPQRFFDTMRVGEIISRLNDAVKIRSFINEVAFSIIVNIQILVFSLGLMFFYYWKLALIMLSIIPFYLLLFTVTNIINRKWQRRLMENSAELEAGLVETLNAPTTIRALNLSEYANLQTETRFVTLLRSVYRAGVKGIYLEGSSEWLNRLFTVILLWAGSYFVINRELTTGELLSFYALAGYFTGPAVSLITANRSIQDALIAADRLFEIIDLETENDQPSADGRKPDQEGDICFQNVSFRYGNGAYLYRDINLTIRRKEITAVVGESGSGKSTLVSLLIKLYPVSAGSISIGNTGIEQLNNASLRNYIAVVPQQVDLFSGTIAENIAIGVAEPDMEKVVSVARELGIDRFVEALPDGYHTRLTENGMNLSGGQRQRLAIARALYRDPAILVLDEATASLDRVSEQKIAESMRVLKERGITVILVAHRLGLAKIADRIVVMKEGAVTETGSHEQLLQNGGDYAALWSAGQ